MHHSVVIPDIGYSMNEVVLVKWFVKVGDEITEGDLLAEIETEKATSEVYSPHSGNIENLRFAEGDSIKSGEVICDIVDSEDETDNNNRLNADKDSFAKNTNTPLLPNLFTQSVKVVASPAAKAIAKDMGIDLEKITGTGPKGRITKDDVLAYDSAQKSTESQETKNEEVEVIPLSATRKTIAKNLLKSKQQIPDVTTFMQIDVTDILEKRKTLHDHISFTAIICFAAVRSILDFPLINSTFTEENINKYKKIHLGIAVESDKGLVVPVVKNASALSLKELSEVIASLNHKAIKNEFMPTDMTGGTFTVTNSGVFGSSFFTPIINPPQVAILGIGNAQKHLKFKGNSIIEGKLLTLCLTYDHRVIDGSYAVNFLASIRKFLEEDFEKDFNQLL